MERKIVIIGMDNTGKTTLVNDMKNILKIESIKSPGPNFTKEEMYEEIITDLSKEEVVILERFASLKLTLSGYCSWSASTKDQSVPFKLYLTVAEPWLLMEKLIFPF